MVSGRDPGLLSPPRQPTLRQRQSLDERLRHERERLERQRRRRSAKRLLLAGLAACIALTTIAIANVARSVRRGGPEAGTPGSAVHEVLQRLRGQWAERDVARRVPESLSAAACRRELRKILAEPSNPLFRPAVVLAVHLGLADVADLLVAAMPHVADDTKQLLVTAVEKLQPWDEKHLVGLIDSGPAVVAVAALQAIRARTPEAGLPVLEHLVAPVAEVRAAALAALPGLLSRHQGEEIMAELDAPGAVQSLEAMLALARCEGLIIEDFLAARLRYSDEAAAAALQAMTVHGVRLREPERVLRVIQDQSQPLRTRALGLLCLEQTATPVDLAELESLPSRGPVLDYLVARQQIQAGRVAGLRLLLDVVSAPDAAAEDGDQTLLLEARMEARRILAQLSGSSLYEDPSVWETFVHAQRELSVGQLTPPTLSLMN